MSNGAITMTKRLGSDVSGFEYDKRTGKGYFMNATGYDQQGQGGSWAKMYILDCNTQVIDSAKRGDKTYKALVYEAGNKLVWPDMHSGYIEMLNLANNVIDSVHIGVTLDEMDVSPDNNSLFIACRLGGSDIIKYDINTLGTTKFKAGSWPCVVRTDSSLNKVFVLNHFQSTISVINPNTNTVTATINLPLAEGRADAIAVMCYDKFLQKIFVSFPEFGNIVKINAVTNVVESTTPIPGFTFNPDGGGSNFNMSRSIKAPTGTTLSCKNWITEAAMRMLMNNLDADVAERPEDLIVYGGSGKAARNWECYDKIIETLKVLNEDETLLVQSGKPVAVFKTHTNAPRVLISNSQLVPAWATWDEFRRLEALGLIMYGQMTAGSWIYIGTQGILQGTYETFAACAIKHFGGTLAGRFVLTAGLGGMGGAQPLAATLNGAAFLGIGNSIHSGMVIVADGTPEAEARLERCLTYDPGMGIVRHADAGYDLAIEEQKKFGINMPMLK
ncbi:unnamed protein product [Rotaria sp. Silwood1]|nr:unnamed protein product [Rotaria sp. Silwood1]CAF4718216.1 unnamed protein product [Rotaria sp. Silwood1]